MNIVVDDPPDSLQSYRYRCDSTFELTQLQEMLIDRTSYGLFVIDEVNVRMVSRLAAVFTVKRCNPTSWESIDRVVNRLRDSRG